ncbi:MAG: sulfate permease [Bacteroidota bacterium]
MNKLFNPKFFSLLKKGFTKDQIQKDILAGIIVGIVALPLAIAFAVASGVSPEKGLITAVIAGFLISFLGGSRVQIGGPTGAFIVIVFGIVTTYGLDGLLISTILAGIILILFGLFRMGSILKFIPHPLIVGFTSGIALVIFSTQMKDAFGLPKDLKVPSEFIEKWITYFTHYNEVNFYAIGITVLTILITLYSRKITTKIPGSFFAIILVTLGVFILKLPVTTIESVFGEIPSSFSFSLPSIDFSNIHNYLAPAFTIAMLGAIESLLSAVVADGMIGTNHRSNTELIAQGIANVITPFFGGIPATGAIARTATNIKNGGRTPIAGMVHAITLLLIMLFFGKYAVKIPMSCLAGILIVVAYNMSEWKSFISIFKGSKYDIAVLLVTFFLTVLVDLTVAIEIGIVLSSLLFMHRMSKLSDIAPREKDFDVSEDYSKVPKGIDIYEISGPFFFGAAKKYNETIREISFTSKVIIIRMRHVPFIDATGTYNFKEVIKTLQAKKVKIILSGVNPEVRAELEKSRIVFMIGKANIFDNFDAALGKATEIVKD